MKPMGLERQLSSIQQSLAQNSFKRFTRLSRSLLEAHRDHSFLKPVADALRAKDYLRFYVAADSLSSQKYDDATSHFVANQFALFVKKYPWPSEILDLRPRDAAVKSFLISEWRCKRINRKHRLLDNNPGRDRHLDEMETAIRWIRTVIGSRPSYRGIFARCDFGPGASIGVHGNATNSLAKQLAERWTVTPGALHHAFAGIMANHQMREQLFEHRNGYYCVDYEYAFTAYMKRVEIVGNNKISFVEKTAKTERTIAIEPLLNSFVQKGIDIQLRKRLLNIGIDLSDQSINQKFAREGSLPDSRDPFVTIDLRSASDSVALMLTKRLIPVDWYELLIRTRSPSFELDGVINDFEKVCTMGNGFNFPLQTLVYSAACVACGAGVPGLDFTVYGDDIIVRQSVATSVIDLLKHWGFKTNSDKTFLDGPFRESCGADWFSGEDVRPFTLDYALDTVQNVFKFLNLTRRNKRTAEFFKPVRQEVINFLPEIYRFFRPYPGQEDTGINALGSEFMTCSSCLWDCTLKKWEWLELKDTPDVDNVSLYWTKDEPWLMGLALQGLVSLPYGKYKGLPAVTLRNTTQTKVVRKDNVSTSNWLPT